MEMKGWAFQIDAGAGAKEWTFGRSRQNLPNTKKKKWVESKVTDKCKNYIVEEFEI